MISSYVDTVAAGEIVLEFFANGTVIVSEDGYPVDTLAYSVSGGTLTYDGEPTQFGISGNKFRWKYTDGFSIGGDVYRNESDIVFKAY
jgi:hypothetical protein